jgi:glycosyltransferase involved in cell wall biosynthesis
MMCRRLVVVSDRGVLPLFVTPAGANAVFQSGDVPALAARLSYWLADDSRRDRVATVLRNHALDTYAFDRCGDAYLEAFRTVVAA